MAAYKLEDNIREKLEAREIQPSTGAWKKLEAKLDVQQPKKKPVLWYYVAASFVGLLILASVFFSSNNSEVNNQVVNETTEQNITEKQPEIIPKNSKLQEIASEEKSVEKVAEKQNANSNSIKALPQKKSEIDKKIEKTEAIANVTKQEGEPLLKNTIQKEEDKLFNNKVDEVVASVKKLQQNNSVITATEIEELLNNARNDIQTQRILKNPKVDATALLQDVEWELEKSFRDKVFDALGEGFQKVRTAVSERND